MAGLGMSNYPGGFAQGISIRGVPLVQTHPGKVFWVYNGTTLDQGHKNGSDSNKGTFDQPFATLYYAVQQCRANKGDVIFVKPGHAESIANATTLLLSTAGIAIVGLGLGSARPTLTFTTATTANIPVTAANVSIQNFLFKANFLDIASVFTATGTNTPTDFTIERCEFRDGSSVLNFLSVFTDNATANSCDGFAFLKNKVISLGTTAATTAIIMTNAAHSRVELMDNFLNMAVLNNTAALLAGGANNLLQLQIARNVIVRPNTDTATGGLILTSSSTGCTGMVYDNYVKSLDVAGMLVAPTGTKLGFTNNLMSGTADTSGILIPAADSDAS